MRIIKAISLTLILGFGSVYAADFTTFGDICEPTSTQTCPNKPNEIKALQEALNANPNLYLYIRADGQWSKGTKEAIVVFQERYNIKPASGYLGNYTKKILQRVTHPNAATQKIATPVITQKTTTKSTKPKPVLPNVTPTKEFVLYSDMCDNNTNKANKCPNKLIEVSNLQILLNADPNLNVNISADGKWGRGTQKAVIAFQKYYGISPAKGYIGLQTKKILDRVAGAMVAKATMPVERKKIKPRKKFSLKSINSWKNICETTATDVCPNRTGDVQSLQSFLNHTLGTKLRVDGKWGNGTKQAIIRFQKRNNIKPANGYVGPKTRRIMQQVAQKKPAKSHSKAKLKRTASHPIKTYADFRKYTNYPKTYKVFKNYKLLGKANGKNTKVKVDVSEQRMRLYVGNQVALDSPCTTGSRRKLEPNTKIIRDKSTPKGTFKITEKIAQKRSTIFGDIYIKGKKVYHGDKRKYKGSWKNARFVGAALHDWMRLTSSGIGMHGSKYVKRYPGSNGCIRLPFTVARTVFRKVKPGTQVRIVN
jgi:peptidoglycan hydrolase-like protein with peptidoglycan-binding domain